MREGFQYNERSILDKFFPAIHPDVMGFSLRYLVEIGAADGIDNSNSYDLLKQHDWMGLLVEPHPGYFMDLLKLYTNDLRVKLSNYAVAETTSRRRLGLDNQCSSLVYSKPNSIEVQCVTLTELLDLYHVPKDFEFLSIDCEGADMGVLQSLDWNAYKPQLVCVEHSMPKDALNSFMDTRGYRYFDMTLGNSFFVRK